jgi:hypothetical protein
MRRFRRERSRDRKRYVRWQGNTERWMSEGRDADDRRWQVVLRNKHYRFAYSRYRRPVWHPCERIAGSVCVPPVRGSECYPFEDLYKACMSDPSEYCRRLYDPNPCGVQP